MFRKFLIGAVAVKASNTSTTVESAKKESTTSNDVDELVHYKCKLSDLPLYAPLHSLNKPKRDVHPPKNSAVYETIEGGVRVVRTELQAGYSVLESQKQLLDNYWETAKAHTQSSIDYLNQPHNVMPRSGAIAIGGLAGFIFAARGGIIKKFIYTTAGAGTIASLCYPKQAEHFARDALFEARKGYAIAYNFVKGVKPSDQVPVEPINKFPTTIEDLKYMLLDLYDEAKDAIFSSSSSSSGSEKKK